MATFKQYLQNRWYRGMSFDKEVAYPYQFWYGENVNIRNEKGAVMLSSLPEVSQYNGIRTKSMGDLTHRDYLLMETSSSGGQGHLYSVDLVHYNAPTGGVTLSNWAIGEYNRPYGPFIERFRDKVFVANTRFNGKIYCTSNTLTSGTESGLDLGVLIGHLLPDLYSVHDSITSVYNFANTFFLVGFGQFLLRYQPLTDTYTDEANWKVIRDFGEGWRITGLSQSGNYLRIYATDGVITQCHYAQGTFDLEDSGLVQTVTYEGYLNEDCLATDGVKDYGLFVTQTGLRLLEMDGYSYTTIRETKRVRGVEGASGAMNPLFYTFFERCGYVPARVRFHNNTVYCALPEEGIRTFTKESVGSHGYVWGGVIEWNEKFIGQMEYSQNQLIVSQGTSLQDLEEWDYNKVTTMSLLNHPEKFNQTGFIIGNIYTAGCSSLFKKNVNTTIAYGAINDENDGHTYIKLYYRYDRLGLGWKMPDNLHNFGWNLIKEITVNNVYDMAFTTTGSNFNVPRNTIQYGIVLSRDNRLDGGDGDKKLSPILYEHNLIYEDSMRKYR